MVLDMFGSGEEYFGVVCREVGNERSVRGYCLEFLFSIGRINSKAVGTHHWSVGESCTIFATQEAKCELGSTHHWCKNLLIELFSYDIISIIGAYRFLYS
jgi:hypothetical protein